MDQILDNLWIGDIQDAREKPLSEYGIDVVVTVCQDSVADNVGCTYNHFEMSDGDATDVYGGDSSYGLFEEAVNCVRTWLELNCTTLVHCHHGQSRSGAVCIAIVGVKEDLRYNEALSYVRDVRPIVNPDELLVEHAERYIEAHR